MGGNALKDFGVQRVDKSTFNKIASKLKQELDLLRDKGVISRYDFTASFDSKETYGDADILYLGNPNTIEGLKEYFKPIGSLNNGDCFSFVYQYEDINFQVDMIKSKPEYYDYNLEYFSFNDRSNLVGVTAKKLGFKVSHKGLLYSINIDNQFVKDILVSTDWQKSLEFLKFYDIKSTYDNIEEIFESVAKGSYFNPNLYLFEARNHDARTRDRKRPTYNAFLKWLSENSFPFAFDYSKTNLDKLKIYMFNRAKKMFGNDFVVEYDKVHLNHKNAKLIKEKFNGSIVQECTGLEGKDLGNFIVYFKSRFISFDDYILSEYTDLSRVKNDIMIAHFDMFEPE